MSRKSPEAIRAALQADPNTPKLAEALNMALEDYVKLVVHFATTGEQPQLFVVPDAELAKRGHAPPDLQAMNAFLSEAVAVKLTHEATGYQAPKPTPVALRAHAPAAATPPPNPALSAEVARRRKC